MKDGVIQQVGTPQQLFDHPINEFVAGFIGMPQMNFYSGELLKNEAGKYCVKLDDAVMEVSEEKQALLAKKNVQPQPITVGVRPEHISLGGDSGKTIEGIVDVSEMMGSAIHLHVNACGKDSIIIVPTLDLNGRTFKIGDKINFTFGGNVMHIFGRESHQNLEY